ncbi:MAG: zinc ribbon domain-containing protein [Eubacteriales bacterium]|nr:zinc ribbon domain-containing protein [Eubacteriales bacterium]
MKPSEFSKRPDISAARKALYYTGLGLVVAGIATFLIGFVSVAVSFGRPMDMFAQGQGTSFILPFAGIVMAIIGSVLKNIGARGLAGSGVVLDPRKAREDLHPYTHAAGGMVQDAVKGFKAAAGEGTPVEVVKVRCPNCRALNDEDARFCGQCGQAL